MALGSAYTTSLSAGSGLGLPLGGTQPTPPSFGGNNYTLDGANNNGSSRRIAASPNSDMIQEMRVESSNFDAAVGHGKEVRFYVEHRGDLGHSFVLLPYEVRFLQFTGATKPECLDRIVSAEAARREDQAVADKCRGGLALAHYVARPESLTGLRIEALHEIIEHEGIAVAALDVRTQVHEHLVDRDQIVAPARMQKQFVRIGIVAIGGADRIEADIVRIQNVVLRRRSIEERIRIVRMGNKIVHRTETGLA